MSSHSKSRQNNRFIFTLDLYDGKPSLVNRGKVIEHHSDEDPYKAIQHICVAPDVLVVDLNGAMGINHDDSPNVSFIKNVSTKYYVHVGGGLRWIHDIQDMLERSARRVVLGSASDELISQVPKERLIVEATVNLDNEVLIHGRKTNTHVHIRDRMTQLASIGVEAISITFHDSEGRLNGIPREQIKDIVDMADGKFKKIIIAGGITTIDDLKYLWNIGVIPQLGSAIWKGRMTVGDVISESMNYNEDGLIPGIIQHKDGHIQALIYLDKEAIKRTCDDRKLWRYSREHENLMRKGDTSGDYQDIISVTPDCDSDTLLITVDNKNSMCHTGNKSCFPNQASSKATMLAIIKHIMSRMGTKSYSGKMQKLPGLAFTKLHEEYWEIITAPEEAQSAELADFFAHLIMYMNGIGVDFDDIMNELNARQWDPRLVSNQQKYKKRKNDKARIGITGSKYSGKTVDYVLNELGIQITYGEGRSMKITGEIIDMEKYQKYFGDREFYFITARPKDMAQLLAIGRIDYVVTYETAIENFPKVYEPVNLICDPDISLCLIKRKGHDIDLSTWSSKDKRLIAAEHVIHVTNYFCEQGISPDCYHLDRIIGSSEGFLVQTDEDEYVLCDAVVESGRTLDANDLEVFRTIIPKGQVKMGLYKRIT